MEKKIEEKKIYDVRTEDALKIIEVTNEKSLARARKKINSATGKPFLTVDKRYDAQNGWKMTVFYNRAELEAYRASKENTKFPSVEPETAPAINQPFNMETLATGLVMAVNHVISRNSPMLLNAAEAETTKHKKMLSLTELEHKKFLTLPECAALSGLPPKAFSDIESVSLGSKKGKVISRADFDLRVYQIGNGEYTIPILAPVKKTDKARPASV